MSKKSLFERIFGSKKPEPIVKQPLKENYFGGYAGWGSPYFPSVWNADQISRVNSQYVGIGLGPLGSPNDRHLGYDMPFIRSLSDLTAYRTQSRFVARTNSYAQGIINNIKSYIISGGFRVIVQSEKNKALSDKCQDLIDAWCSDNDFLTIQNECFTRSEIDGEYFIQFKPSRDGNLQVRFIEPELITIPDGVENLWEWSLGIKTDINDTQDVISYGVLSWDRDNTQYVKILPEKDVLHSKNNCTMAMKRGIPSFAFDTLTAITNASKIALNLQVTSAAQASITFFREHESATQPQVDEFISTQLISGTMGQPLAGYPYGAPSAYQGVETTAPGTVIDMPQTLKYVEAPAAKNTTIYLDVLHSALREATKKWCAPSWIASGDSTESSYASSLTAESPFLRNCTRLQQSYKRSFTEIMTRVLNNCAVAGLIPLDWKSKVELHVEPPSLETREPLKLAQADSLYYSMGAKSLHEVCAGFGGDLDKAQQYLRKEKKMNIVKGDITPPVSGAGNGHVAADSKSTKDYN